MFLNEIHHTNYCFIQRTIDYCSTEVFWCLAPVFISGVLFSSVTVQTSLVWAFSFTLVMFVLSFLWSPCPPFVPFPPLWLLCSALIGFTWSLLTCPPSCVKAVCQSFSLCCMWMLLVSLFPASTSGSLCFYLCVLNPVSSAFVGLRLFFIFIYSSFFRPEHFTENICKFKQLSRL